MQIDILLMIALGKEGALNVMREGAGQTRCFPADRAPHARYSPSREKIFSNPLLRLLARIT